MTSPLLPWFAIRTRSNFERATSLSLKEKGYETFLPVYRCRRKWTDRTKEIEVPLFSGYTFCRFDAGRRLPILQTPGVVSILGSRITGPIPVEESEVAAISRMIQSGVPVGPWPFLREGQYVTVERGPLAGVEGFIVQVKAHFRLIVSVSLLQRAVYAELDRDWVRPSTPLAGSQVAAVRI